MSHLKQIPGKDIANNWKNPDDTTLLEFEIPDDKKVVGFGMPISMALCRKIVYDYHQHQTAIYTKLNQLPTSDDITTLKSYINSKTEIVSGIYGRDTLMQILSQEGCEGIKYVNCYYGDQNSIVLIGVDKEGNPIGGKDQFLTDARKPGEANAVIYEVKGGSLTREKINDSMQVGISESENITSLFKAIL